MRALIKKTLSTIIKIDEKIFLNRVRKNPKKNLQNILWERAAQQSADFVENHLQSCLIFGDKVSMWNHVGEIFDHDTDGGICLEFGVASGVSINWLSKSMPNYKFYGFDSFVGLKEDWKGHHSAKGAYSQNGITPAVNSNVSLIEGWFDVTLPLFIKNNQDQFNQLTLLHIDSDTYESATVIFDELSPFFKPGLVILFDELIGYPNWQNGEYRALCEAKEKYDFDYKFLAFSSEQALVQLC